MTNQYSNSVIDKSDERALRAEKKKQIEKRSEIRKKEGNKTRHRRETHPISSFPSTPFPSLLVASQSLPRSGRSFLQRVSFFRAQQGKGKAKQSHERRSTTIQKKSDNKRSKETPYQNALLQPSENPIGPYGAPRSPNPFY